MSEQLDQVVSKITELTEAIKARGGTQEMDREALVAELGRLFEEKSQADIVRKGETETPHEEKRLDSKPLGRYARLAKHINEDGKAKVDGREVKAVDLYMAKTLLDAAANYKAQRQGFTGVETVHGASEDLSATVKALTATGSATGDEYVPTGMAAELWQDMFLASRVASDLDQTPMPTDPFDAPLDFGALTWYKGGEGAASPSYDPATAKSTLTATEQIVEVNWSYNFDEDAVIAVMPNLRRRLAQSGGLQMDKFVLDADSTASASSNINLIDGTPETNAYYLSSGQDGLRHLPLVDNTSLANTCGGDALADADFSSLFAEMGKYVLDLQNARIVPSVESYLSMMGLTNVITVDKYGPQATILSGELMKYRGIPVIPSEALLKANNAGKYAASAGTLGNILVYNRNMWTVGYRRNMLIEVDRNIQTRQLIMVVSFRIAVGAFGTRSSATHTGLLYNHTF